MILIILIAFGSLLGLIVLHEFGHFVMAKKFGVDVEEFGIGYPPRIIGKKFGNTIYSLNLIPFGAFVKIRGEEGGIEDYHSFTGKPLWQRALIILGGVVAFWIIAAVILSVVFALGMPTPVLDGDNHNLINPKIQVTFISPKSPAEEAGLKPLDTILKIKSDRGQIETDKVGEVIGFINANKGEKVTLTIDRWGKVSDITLVPRVSVKPGEGAIGIGLARMALVPYPWYEAPFRALDATWRITLSVASSVFNIFNQLFQGKALPSEATPMGPVGIFDFLRNAFLLGVNYFLYFVALISISLAVFNLLPIPALDGGKMLFLGIEFVMKKPVPPKIEQNITAAFFFALIILMLFVTIKFDIPKLF